MDDDQPFARLAAEFLRRPGVDLGRMFNAEGLRVRGKVFAFPSNTGQLVVKLPAARIDALEATGTGSRITMGKRTMREWVSVPPPPPASLAPWDSLADEALEFVGSES